MSNYFRTYGTGMPIFITAVTHKRAPLLISHIELLRSSISKVKFHHPFKINAYVFLPDHFHMLITLPEWSDNFSTRIRLIKTYFSKNLQYNNRVWQHRFWEHIIRHELDYKNHLNYIHFNPVKHGYVKRVFDWPHSSFHEYVKRGVYQSDWGDLFDEDQFGIEAGE